MNFRFGIKPIVNFFPTQNSQTMELNHLIRLLKVYNGFNAKPKIHISTYLIYFSVFFISYYILFFYSLNREFSFQLTDPIRRNVYQFRTECVEETNLWLHHLNLAVNSNDISKRSSKNLMSFD
jgi:hypothetical protein